MSGKSNNPPFWVLMVVLGTACYATSLFIDKTDILSTAQAETAADAPKTTPVKTTDYASYYLQSVDYLCDNVLMPMSIVSTVRGLSVLVVEKRSGHIYNAAAFNQKLGHCVPVAVGPRRTTPLMVDDYYNRIIDKLYPNNVR